MKTFTLKAQTNDYNLFYWLPDLYQIIKIHCFAIADTFPVQAANEPKMLSIYFHFRFQISGKQWSNVTLPREYRD